MINDTVINTKEREILFRGKLTSTGKWVEGLVWKKKYDDGKRIFISYFPYCDDEERCDVVKKETIGEFVGFYDKNGKKIFEGDFVKVCLSSEMFKTSGDICIVEFSPADGAFGVRWRRNGLSNVVEQFTPFSNICGRDYEVIGNIHDNPELWEEIDE